MSVGNALKQDSFTEKFFIRYENEKRAAMARFFMIILGGYTEPIPPWSWRYRL